jgi:hypothetical protein
VELPKTVTRYQPQGISWNMLRQEDSERYRSRAIRYAVPSRHHCQGLVSAKLIWDLDYRVFSLIVTFHVRVSRFVIGLSAISFAFPKTLDLLCGVDLLSRMP